MSDTDEDGDGSDLRHIPVIHLIFHGQFQDLKEDDRFHLYKRVIYASISKEPRFQVNAFAPFPHAVGLELDEVDC